MSNTDDKILNLLSQIRKCSVKLERLDIGKAPYNTAKSSLSAMDKTQKEVDDETTTCCELLSSAIGTIVQQSENEEFRNKCLSLLGVDDTSEVTETVMRMVLHNIKRNNKRKQQPRKEQS